MTDFGALGQLSFQHLFLHQVLHSADLHLVHIVHKARPVCGPVRTHHRFRLGGGVDRRRIFVSGGHTVATVADAKAPQSRGNARPGERSPTALARYWPVVPVNLWTDSGCYFDLAFAYLEIRAAKEPKGHSNTCREACVVGLLHSL